MEQLGIIVFGFVCYLILAILKKEWALYAIIILLPTYQIRFHIDFIPMTFLEGMILIEALVVSVNLARAGELKKFFLEHIIKPWTRTLFVLLFIIGGLIAVYVAPNSVAGAGIFKAYIAEAILFGYILLALIDTEKKRDGLIVSFMVLVGYLSLFGIYQFLTLFGLPESWWAVDVASRRIVSLAGHPNSLAHLIGPPVVFLLFYLLMNWYRAWYKYLFAAIVGLGVIALFLSFSRAGILAFLATVFIVGLTTSYRKKLVIFSVFLILLLFLFPYPREKFVDIIQGHDLAQENRIILWTAAVDMIKKSPLTGTGLTGFHEAYKNYPLGPDGVVHIYPHNFVLNFWLEMGFLGLISILGLIVLYYKKLFLLFKKNKNIAIPCIAAMLVILIHGLVDVPYFKNDLSVLFWSIYFLPFLKIK